MNTVETSKRRREDMKTLAQIEEENRKKGQMRVALALSGALVFCLVVWYGIVQLVKRFF